MPKSVDKSSLLKEVAEVVALLWRDPCAVSSLVTARDVNVLVSNVEISADDHGHASPDLFILEVPVKVSVPLLGSILEALKLLTSVRYVGCH